MISWKSAGYRAVWLGLMCSTAWSLDDGLFNKFYLEGDHITYVLILRNGAKKTFDLYGPNGEHVAGTVRASDEDVTLTAGDVKRFLHWDLKDRDLKLGRRDNDKIVRGSLLGGMPPAQGERVLYLSEKNWLRKGLPAFTPPALPLEPADQPPAVTPPAVTPPATPEREPEPPVIRSPSTATPPATPATPVVTDADPPVPPPAPPPAAAPATPKDLSGEFSCRVNAFITETISFSDGGAFTYKDSNGAEAAGTSKLDAGVLTLTSGEVVREFSATFDGKALSLTRTANDAPKFKNDLASMSPTVLKSAKYDKK